MEEVTVEATVAVTAVEARVGETEAGMVVEATAAVMAGVKEAVEREEDLVVALVVDPAEAQVRARTAVEKASTSQKERVEGSSVMAAARPPE